MQTEALFEGIAERICLELEQAEHSIYIVVTRLTNSALFNMLLQKSQQGLNVHLILSNHKNNQQRHIDYSQLNIGSSVSYLIESNADNLMHSKFCVIDSNTVINGSYNWSSEVEGSHEDILITKGNLAIAKQFVSQFEKIRDIYFEPEDSTPDLPLDKVIKRLEIIKNYLILEDVEDIIRENKKLQEFSFQHDIASITQALEQHDFSEAMSLIDKFIKDNHAVTIYSDIDLTTLKLEIRQLENKLNAYDNEKIELNKALSEFHYRHANELSTYLSQILSLRKILTKNNPTEYAETVENEKVYKEKIEIDTAKTIHMLNDEQRVELKKAYRKASQICHPDRVTEKMKQLAQEAFIHLNTAYEKNDLAEVEKILSELQKGMFKSRSETVSEKEHMKVIIQTLKSKIERIEEEVSAIKDSEDYQSISSIADWNDYFEQKKAELINVISDMEAQVAH